VQYRCAFCDTLIVDIKASGVVRLVECWLPSGKNSGAMRVQEKFIYAHKICCETGKVVAQQDALF